MVQQVPIGGEPRSTVFTPTGDTAYIAVSHQPVEDEGSILVYAVNKDKVTGQHFSFPAPPAAGLVQ
ncbi:MAG: hypothetical protein M1309_06085 [Actinobacteria bacterium]|nr:hypothetical protein [Actinomycetota bacterium]